MKVEEALRIILLYASNSSSCGKLPKHEQDASRILRKFIQDLKSTTDLEELRKMIDERL